MFQRTSHIWLCVEEIRRTSTPKTTAKDACIKLAEAGGVSYLTGGNQNLGLSYSIKSRIFNPETIYRQYKLAEQLRKKDGKVAAAWENMLADGMGRERPKPARMETGRKGPAKSKKGKTAEK